MTNKRCFLVTAYCNTPQKKEVLNDTLLKLKKYNIDIILFSHYPIDDDVYKLTDYSLYDYSNPIFDDHPSRSMVNWHKHKNWDVHFKFNTHAVDYGFAAAQQIKRGLLFANEIGYDEAFVLNYDLIIEDKMINDFKEWISDYDSIMLEYANKTGVKGLYMAWFGLKIKPFIDSIQSITVDDYFSKIGEDIVENYLYPKFKNNNSKIIPTLEWQGPDELNGYIKTSIVMEGSVYERFDENNFAWFIGHEIYKQNNERVDSGKQLLMLWDIKKNLSEINHLLISSRNKYILVTGSLYLVGKIRKKYL